LRCWDIRNTTNDIFTVYRKCTTNQRLYFDLDPSGNYLHTGDQDGQLLVYDLSSYGTLVHQQKIHSDSCNSISIHPSFPFIVSSSGQRRFLGDESTSDEEQEAACSPCVSVLSTAFYVVGSSVEQSSKVELDETSQRTQTEPEPERDSLQENSEQNSSQQRTQTEPLEKDQFLPEQSERNVCQSFLAEELENIQLPLHQQEPQEQPSETEVQSILVEQHDDKIEMEDQR